MVHSLFFTGGIITPMLVSFHFLPVLFLLREISSPELADEVLTFTGYQNSEMDFEMHSWRATCHDEFHHKKQRKKWLKFYLSEFSQSVPEN
jgi:hypothetical protein